MRDECSAPRRLTIADGPGDDGRRKAPNWSATRVDDAGLASEYVATLNDPYEVPRSLT